jgi:hypothetical protein
MTETIIDSGGWSSETIMCGRAPDHIIAREKPPRDVSGRQRYF